MDPDWSFFLMILKWIGFIVGLLLIGVALLLVGSMIFNFLKGFFRGKPKR